MKKSLVLIVLFIVLIIPCYTQQIAVSVSDFKVESDDPSHKYLGKGLSRLVASELRKSARIKLLEREQMMSILEEQEFSLSDMVKTESQVKVGMLMSADRIVFGEIIDMGNVLLISLRMADVETGEIVWQEEITERLRTYNYIAAYFAKSILTEMELGVETSIAKKVEAKEEKDEQAVIRLSEGIDAYDRGDETEAKKALKIAKRIDPKNETVDYYLAKLVTNTAKFKVITEPYYSYQNPAYLGLLKADRFHLANGGNWISTILYGDYPDVGYAPIPGYPNLFVREQDYVGLNLGYYFPIGSNLGIGAEVIWAQLTDDVIDEPVKSVHSMRKPLGAIVNLGYRFSHSAAVGLGVSVYSQRDPIFEWGEQNENYPFREDVDPVAVAANAGFLWQNSAENVVFDTRVGYTTGSMDVVDFNTVTIKEVIGCPLFWENTLTLSNKDKNTFFVVKQLNDVGLDRSYYYGRLLPAVEHYFANWFSSRIGPEGALVILNESLDLGYGVLGGVTFRVLKWKLDIDLNVTYRKKPSRVVEGMMRDDVYVSFILNLNDVFLSRE